MNKKPFFSIVIPTYNRPEDLKIAIIGLLGQKFKDYEIVISDNSTDDQSEKVCQSFDDTRIKYSRNKENIGFARNLYKVIKSAQGQYVFIHGDDDFLLNKQILTNLHKLLMKSDYGFVRVKILYHHNYKFIFDMNPKFSDAQNVLAKNSTNRATIDFIYKANIALISGLIFKNSKINIPEIEKSKDSDFIMEVFWIRFIYEQAKRLGGYIDSENSIMVKWIIQKKNNAGAGKDTPSLVAVINNRLYMEKSWNFVLAKLNDKERKQWIREQAGLMVPLLPSVKFYSSNLNLLLFVKRMLELNKDLYANPSLYSYIIIGLLMPRWLWNKLRTVVQKKHAVSDLRLNQELADFKKLNVK